MQTQRVGPQNLYEVLGKGHDRKTERRRSTPTLISEDPTKKKRTPEQEEEIAKWKSEEKEIEGLRIRQAFLEGRIMELEKTQAKFEKENKRDRAGTNTNQIRKRKIELDKQERNISHLKHEAKQRSSRIKELEITNEQVERSEAEIQGKMRELQEDIKKLCTEKGPK